MAVADVGAGTGFITRLIVDPVRGDAASLGRRPFAVRR